MYDIENSKLLHMKGTLMDVYVPTNLSTTRHMPDRWIRHRIVQAAEDQGKICTVRGADVALTAVESIADPPKAKAMPGSFLEVLKEWGCTWMWDSLRLFGNDDWIKGAIENGSLICVTDESYIKEMIQDLCPAAFILECKDKKGEL